MNFGEGSDGGNAQRERFLLWKMLHDLVLLELADFAVDFEEMERLNELDKLEAELSDSNEHRMLSCRLLFHGLRGS